MNTPHTPGPWAIDSDVSTDVIRMDGSRDRIGVADCMSFDGPEIEECEANARLIAAAPDLLEAVLLAHKYMGIVNFDYEESSEQDQDLHTETYLTIQDAIAKAIGQIP